MKNRRMILVPILLLIIGFASVSATLFLNGTIGVTSKTSDFNVIFISAISNGNNEVTSTISEDKKTITFEINKLSVVGDNAKLIYKVKNNSTQYDANVSITCTGGNEEYLIIASEFAGNILPLSTPELIRAQEIKTGSIRAELKKASVEEKNISITCTLNVEGEERDTVENYTKENYTEALLNGADPVIKEGLVPVVLSDDGSVTKADTTSEWYSYENKKWANAVILVDSPSTTYNVGDTIDEIDIESYFVWVPKYKYKLWNIDNYKVLNAKPETSNAREIEIAFTTEDTTNIDGVSCETPLISGEIGNCDNGEYMTHPAFISMGVTGFWVGKFETGYAGANTASEARVDSKETDKIIIKPNVYSWRDLTIGNMFEASYNYNRDLDSHMMKNTEWGAVVYLSHTKYGINKEVNINNSQSYKTGYSALPSTDQNKIPGEFGDGDEFNQPYNTYVGYLASTTGNITGVYDMSGNGFEAVASYVQGKYGNSGFTSESIVNYDSKYFDLYSNNTKNNNYTGRILGDATAEMGPFFSYNDGDSSRLHNSWYNGRSYFITDSNPWFYRGGSFNDGALAGPFSSGLNTGVKFGYATYRICLL